MNESKQKTKVKLKSKENLAEQLNKIPIQQESVIPIPDEGNSESLSGEEGNNIQNENASEKETKNKQEVSESFSELFDKWEDEYEPQEFKLGVPIDSFESQVGYTSLIRQLHNSFLQMVAFYRSSTGGALPPDAARSAAFRACRNKKEAKRIFAEMASNPLDNLDFNDLNRLYSFSPRVAEQLWEKIKQEGQAEFESGHFAANTMLPVDHMRDAWTVARYLGIRESFIAEWNPKGGIEVSLIDMMAQAFFQFQYWTEQTVRRSQTRAREEHPDYEVWKRCQQEKKGTSWDSGYWFPPYVHEQEAIEHAVKMADRWNRLYLRTLRQLRDLRRYSPVTINNPSQVNIAAEGGQQINVSKTEKPLTKKITS